jgi:RNA polymerase sigma-70 factor (ECF subfamily)
MSGVADDLETDLALETHAHAFDAFVEARRDAAVRAAYRLLAADHAAAEDVAQNAFLRAYQGLGRFRGEAAISTWFYRILVREVHRHRRWQRLRRLWDGERGDRAEVADTTPPGDPVLRRRIQAALSQLTLAQREAFVLVHLEGFSIDQAAKILGKAPGTVKSHMHRALLFLRHDLADIAAERNEP